MTLQEAKDEVAKRLGFKNWDSAVWYEIDESNNITSKPYSEERANDEAAELYARSKWDEAVFGYIDNIYKVFPERNQSFNKTDISKLVPKPTFKL